jgi:hypothetical protein
MGACDRVPSEAARGSSPLAERPDRADRGVLSGRLGAGVAVSALPATTRGPPKSVSERLAGTTAEPRNGGCPSPGGAESSQAGPRASPGHGQHACPTFERTSGYCVLDGRCSSDREHDEEEDEQQADDERQWAEITRLCRLHGGPPECAGLYRSTRQRSVAATCAAPPT